jgi:DNA polymerase (family 10)
MAALLAEQGVEFKPAAYRRAAVTLEDLGEDVSVILKRSKTPRLALKALMEFPGIGEAIASKIIEFLETGHIRALNQLLSQQGGISPELMEVENLGPKRARQIQQALGVTTVSDLIKAAGSGKLRTLPRFSEVMERKVLESAKRVTERKRRFPRLAVKKDAEAILQKIHSVDGVERCAIGGSYRREKETIGDLDILVTTRSPRKVSEVIAALPIVRKVVAQGERKMSFDLKSDLRVDIRFIKRSQWGSALLYFTGDKEHNIALRKRAMERGWKLNEYGLFEGTKAIASREEEGIYKALGLPYLEPTQRIGKLPH